MTNGQLKILVAAMGRTAFEKGEPRIPPHRASTWETKVWLSAWDKASMECEELV